MNKLAIVGAEPLTRDHAPWDDMSFDIWTISNWANAEWAKRVTASIEIHKPKLYNNHPLDPGYWEYLVNTDAPVLMQDHDGDVKSSLVYPLAQIKDLTSKVIVKGQQAQILNSSITYCIALAILRGYKQIDVYGVEMSNSSEYRSQQSAFTFWVGFAAGRGIQLNINCTQALLVQPLYGYEDSMNNDKLHSYIEGIKEDQAKIEAQQAELLRQSNLMEGAMMLARQLLEE